MAAASALVGVALYALLLPWHLTSQFDRQLFAAEFGEAAALICSDTADGSPEAPASSCPICKGLAAFQFALAAAPHTITPPLPVRSPSLLPLREDVASVLVPLPRSRGPPSQA